MNEPESTSNLDWLALEYVSDSLTPEDREAFEERLLDSQDAREAVARAVELTLAANFVCAEATTAAAPRSASPVGRERPYHRLGSRLAWAAIAASVAFVIGWQASIWFLTGQQDRGPGSAESPIATSESGRDLALAWSESRQLSAEGELDRELLDLAGAPPEGDEPNDVEENTTAGAVEAPSWMLAAVAGLQGAPLNSLPDAESDSPGAGPDSPLPAKSNEG